MKVDAKDVESVVLALSKGVALVFPVSQPIVAALSVVLASLDAAGIIPEETHAVDVDELRAISAGMAAAQASAVTSYREHKA